MGGRENWNQLGVHGFTGGETCVERGRSGREGRGEEGGREIQEVRGGVGTKGGEGEWEGGRIGTNLVGLGLLEERQVWREKRREGGDGREE